MKRHTSTKNGTDGQSLVDKLPEDIILNFLKCLPLHCAAKSSLISKRFFYAWKALPELRFDAEFCAKVAKNRTPTTDEFCSILSMILLSHVGPITVFYLSIPELNSSKTLEIGPWISHLSRNDVKRITIRNLQKSPLKLSYHLFSCRNLEKLTLENCILNLVPFFEVLRNLKSIKLEGVAFKGSSFAAFIARCPVLQSLTLTRCHGLDRIYIASPNLKYLTISGKFLFVHFRYAKNLTAFSAALEEMVPYYENTRALSLLMYLAHSCRIEKLSFGGHFCKVFSAGKTERIFPMYFRCLKSLQLSNIKTTDRDELNFVIGMIKSCPLIDDLTISFSSTYCADYKVDLDPDYQLSYLRKVHLSSVLGVIMELKLIKFLLLCSPVLETMCVKRDGKITKVLESRLTRELMSYCRASTRARIVYMEP